MYADGRALLVFRPFFNSLSACRKGFFDTLTSPTRVTASGLFVCSRSMTALLFVRGRQKRVRFRHSEEHCDEESRAIPHNSGVQIAPSEFSSDRTKAAENPVGFPRIFGRYDGRFSKQDVRWELCGVALGQPPSARFFAPLSMTSFLLPAGTAPGGKWPLWSADTAAPAVCSAHHCAAKPSKMGIAPCLTASSAVSWLRIVQLNSCVPQSFLQSHTAGCLRSS